MLVRWQPAVAPPPTASRVLSTLDDRLVLFCRLAS
jgi:hypothetical protein